MKSALCVVVFALLLPIAARADAPADVRAVLATQVEAWNRGDIPTFMTSYAEDCIFVGPKITRGKAQLLARYQSRYPTPAAMGRLTFSDMDIHMIDPDVAVVTAKWHLDRAAADGGPVGGFFSLVVHREKGGWKIALDHTHQD